MPTYGDLPSRLVGDVDCDGDGHGDGDGVGDGEDASADENIIGWSSACALCSWLINSIRW